MSRRSIGRRLEGLEGRLGTGRRMLKVEFYDEAPDGTLIRCPELENGDDGEADQTIRVVFVHTDSDGDGGPGPG